MRARSVNPVAESLVRAVPVWLFLGCPFFFLLILFKWLTTLNVNEWIPAQRGD
jgi:hypothetical protein